ncbi:MAG: hypothetical protein IKS41_04615 [Alphaproteobacteria bacterium]|nr:hypothetical protein [Alphaproteobacteria bacterium]
MLRSESGRSMVEMLGVLAIIGVLSIGGIAGYTYGMNKYRTNELLDGGNKRAYTVATQLSMGVPVNISEFEEHNVTAGGVFDNSVTKWQGQFGLKVSGITKPVCENLIRVAGEKGTLQVIAKTDENATAMTLEDCALENNTVYFVYNTDMEAKDNPSASRNSSTGGGSAASSTGGSEEPDAIEGESCPVDGEYGCDYANQTLRQCIGGVWDSGSDSCGNPDNNPEECLKGSYKCVSATQIMKCKAGWMQVTEDDTEGKCSGITCSIEHCSFCTSESDCGDVGCEWHWDEEGSTGHCSPYDDEGP